MPGNGMIIPEFVQKAFNDELKFASIYSDSGTQLAGTSTKIEFSSVSGLTGGWWDLGLRLPLCSRRTASFVWCLKMRVRSPVTCSIAWVTEPVDQHAVK
jgi:hypothetical protein